MVENRIACDTGESNLFKIELVIYISKGIPDEIAGASPALYRLSKQERLPQSSIPSEFAVSWDIVNTIM